MAKNALLQHVLTSPCASFYPSQKVRKRYNEKPTLSETLELLVKNERAEKKKEATEGLLWLLRGQSFTCKALQNVQNNPLEEIAPSFGQA